MGLYRKKRVIDEILKKKGQYYHFIDNTLKYTEISGVGVGTKSFISTESCLIIHNHRPMLCLNGGCKEFYVPHKDGHLFHYKTYCGEPVNEDCKGHDFPHAPNDTSLWKYREEIIRNIDDVKWKIEKFDYDD